MSAKTHKGKTGEGEIMQTNDTMTEVFGEVISCYSRADAIADGVLVDVSEDAREAGFKFPVAMTIGAYTAAIEAGGKWEPEALGDGEILQLPGGQDCKGRLWDVFTMLKHAIRRPSTIAAMRRFSVLVDVHGNGRHTRVDLKSICGPGDTAAPVLTIMLPNED